MQDIKPVKFVNPQHLIQIPVHHKTLFLKPIILQVVLPHQPQYNVPEKHKKVFDAKE